MFLTLLHFVLFGFLIKLGIWVVFFFYWCLGVFCWFGFFFSRPLDVWVVFSVVFGFGFFLFFVIGCLPPPPLGVWVSFFT